MTAEPLLLLTAGQDPLAPLFRAVLGRLSLPWTEEGAALSHCWGVAVTQLVPRSVSEVYAGICLTPQAALLHDALWQRKPVFVPLEGVDWPRGGGVLRLRWRERLAQLRRAGLVLAPVGEILTKIAHGQEDAPWKSGK